MQTLGNTAFLMFSLTFQKLVKAQIIKVNHPMKCWSVMIDYKTVHFNIKHGKRWNHIIIMGFLTS